MKKKSSFKKLVAAFALAAGVAALPALVSGDEIVKVVGQDNKVIGSYRATAVSHIEFAEGNLAEVSDNYIVIPLSDAVSFKMIKVEGGIPYTLTNQGTSLTAGAWADGGATKQMEDFWIGEFEVTQGIWKEVMGITDAQLPVSNYDTPVGSTILPKGAKQSAIGDDFPIANVSWDDICTGDDCFLNKINAKLQELKQSDPALAAALGDREFRLPNEWEWEYAAAGGKNYQALAYYYSGTQESTTEALQTVAVNSVSPNSATAVVKVGSKAPNALGLYDMSGNVWERLSGLEYPGHENEHGFLDNNGTWKSSYHPTRSGSWSGSDALRYRISYRNSAKNELLGILDGFRLAL